MRLTPVGRPSPLMFANPMLRTGTRALLCSVLLVTSSAGDTIRQTDGKLIKDVSIVEETLGQVSYKEGNSTRSVKSESVAGVTFDKYPRLVDEAEAAILDENYDEALQLLDDFVDGQIANPRERRKWAPAYAAWRTVQLRMELSDLDGVVSSADRLIQNFADSRYLPSAFMAKATALSLSGKGDRATRALEDFERLITSKTLSKRWELECRLAKIQVDSQMSGQQRREALSQVAAEADEFPSVISRARVVEGETWLAQAERNPAGSGDLYQKAQVIFAEIIQDASADDETLAGAYTGLGDCLFYGASGNAEKLKDALMHYLRVVVLYEGQNRYVPKALFYAMLCFDQLDDRRGKADMKRTLTRDYPGSKWAAEAAKR